MKRLFMFLAAIGTTITANLAIAQDAVASLASEETAVPLHQVLKKNFIDGGPLFMTPIILCLILGLAFVIERIIYLNLADNNTKKLVDDVENALVHGGIESAKDLCRDTRGPVASIFYQGLDRASEGVEMVEKAVVNYGGVQMGKLESNLSWIALFIAISPSLGFLGTVIGMVQAFNAIENAGQISPTVVAAGMKVALITTVAGLIVAIILQLFYNYILAKVDAIVNKMEDASITLVDLVIKHKNK
ncbi:MAG: MotA/TolQ/ExbB proton channel family protein [Prevotellaceae bacterium]|jgi:biopolymer transport protein ExbB|nr:MotA/TolQ/ExbB proton channel family protein [Prevotellaceae bacterium]